MLNVNYTILFISIYLRTLTYNILFEQIRKKKSSSRKIPNKIVCYLYCSFATLKWICICNKFIYFSLVRCNKYRFA